MELLILYFILYLLLSLVCIFYLLYSVYKLLELNLLRKELNEVQNEIIRRYKLKEVKK